MNCSKCGSNNISVQIVNTQKLVTSHHGVIWWLCIGWMWIPIKWIIFTLPALIFKIFGIGKKHKIKNIQKKVFICQNCGHTWNVQHNEHTKEKNVNYLKEWWVWYIVIIIFIGFITPFFKNEESKDNSEKIQEIQEPSNTLKQENIIKYLNGTNSDDFIEIIKAVTYIENISNTTNENDILYVGENQKYNINMNANKDTKEISYLKITSLTNEDSTNVFMSINRMDYTTENAGDYTKWLVANIGKESTIKIGDAYFSLSLSLNNHPILEVKTTDNK